MKITGRQIPHGVLNLRTIIGESRLETIRIVVADEYTVEYYRHEPTNTVFSVGSYPISTDEDPTIHEIFGRKRNIRNLIQLLTESYKPNLSEHGKTKNLS